MCYFSENGMHFNTRAQLEAYERRLREEVQKCVPASEADQSIFSEIIQPVKQEQFVSAYLAKR